MKLYSNVVRILTLCVLIASAGLACAQQTYPNKPIRVIVPYPPGSATAALARLFGQKLTESWGQQVLVDERGGGNTIIGSESLVKSSPDGYTIMAMMSTHVIVPLINPAPFDAVKDFAPVSSLTRNELVMAINPSVPASNLQEFIALAKSKPGQLNFASGGTGSVTHLTAELFDILADVKMQHVPYKGPGQVMPDLIGGRVQLFFTSPMVVMPHSKSGKLRVLAISGEKRLSTMPDVPTFTEAGLPGFDAKVWFGTVAPVSTPKGIIDKLATEIARIATLPDVKNTVASLGMEPFVTTPDQFGALMKADSARYAKIIKTANIKVEN